MSDETVDRSKKIENLPLVPLRDVVVFPYTMIPFVVGRKSSLVAVERALTADKRIFLATQRDAKIDDPKPEEISFVGTIANIVQSLKLPNGNIKPLVERIFTAVARAGSDAELILVDDNSQDGTEAIARIAPFRGSIATAAPRPTARSAFSVTY